MSGILIAVPLHKKLGAGFTERERQKSFEHPGRQTNPKLGYQSAVSWIDDLRETRKAILLCSFCAIKFDPRSFRYRKIWLPGTDCKVDGKCEACKQLTFGGTGYVSEESYPALYPDRSAVRRAARAATYGYSTYR